MRQFIILLPFFLSGYLFAQDLDLLDKEVEEPVINYTQATFKTNRLINGHSVEMVSKKEFDFKISHRFGFVNTGFYELFGLDQANIRIGGDFGITDRLNMGFGRSTVEKTYDGFIKYKVLRQSEGEKNMPLSVVAISHLGINTMKWPYPDRENYFNSRLHYTHQLLIARKFSERFSFQFSPTLVHKNLVDSLQYSNDILALGFGFRQKLSKRVSINMEYFFVLPDQIPQVNTDALSIGFDIETGGHIFQLFFTNTTAPFEKGFITDTKGDWFNGDIRFGFNVARIFNF